mmetsp:Transcript_10710/g.22129  ORF Transcript_10710/g.22129 Transcript_10710/m.22129 type:complete len:259 (-) Transcript_10710:174-950(-)
MVLDEDPVDAKLMGKEEDQYDHVGFGHLEAIAGASASLGLISTLVFSLCISCMTGVQISETPIKMKFACLAAYFSTYTTCYSLLEYYYSQMFIGVERYLGGRVAGDEATILKDRVELVTEVQAVFATFNTMRAAARNSMWMGLLCLVISAMTDVNPFDGIVPEMSSSASTCFFFTCCLAMVGPAWYLTSSRDFALYCQVCAGGIVATAAEAFLVRSSFPFARLVAFLILLAAIGVVPFTVMSFRGPLLDLVKKYVSVY